MKLSRERLLREAGTTGFRPESLEKVIRLVGLLNGIFRHADLRERLVLKGGTALNLFLFDVPRLSVDIDLNYIGSVDRKGMEEDRPALESKLQAVFEADDFTVRRMPTDHAGGKWQLRYAGAQGQGGNLEVDLNFLHRIPLEPIQTLDSKPLGTFQAKGIPVLDIHDLAAGKLVALLDRCAARDVFDAAGLFAHPALDMERLRLPFVVMGAMSRDMDLRAATPERVMDTLTDFDSMVRPLLRQGIQGAAPEGIQTRTREGLARLLPLRPHEVAFVEALWERGEIRPDLLSSSPETQARIAAMPLLLWKAQNVRQHWGL
ncbi:MAG: nucleotidyl transferase AbiEii/AbiGii toxin family protein [Holophagaceae bacterium]|nr:nucleotidyl transferase AbiEii/AbiGii toxin family protein [Holophagaceae bacterium]